MPSITLTLPVAGTGVTAGLHATNYAALQTLLNGGLDHNNLADGAVTSVKLAAGAAGPGDPVASLPGSPVDKQQVILVDSLTAPTYQWLLQYEAGISGSNKWMCIGGVPVRSYVETDQGTASASYTDLGTVGPTFTVPRAGKYLVSFGAQIYNTGGGINLAAIKIGAAAAADAQAVQGPPVATPGASVFRVIDIDAAASDVLKMVYKTSTGTGQFARRNMAIIPIALA